MWYNQVILYRLWKAWRLDVCRAGLDTLLSGWQLGNFTLYDVRYVTYLSGICISVITILNVEESSLHDTQWLTMRAPSKKQLGLVRFWLKQLPHTCETLSNYWLICSITPWLCSCFSHNYLKISSDLQGHYCPILVPSLYPHISQISVYRSILSHYFPSIIPYIHHNYPTTSLTGSIHGLGIDIGLLGVLAYCMPSSYVCW